MAEVRCHDPRRPSRIHRKPFTCLAILSLPTRNVGHSLSYLDRLSLFLTRARRAKPNAAHEALAKFSFPQCRWRIAPDSRFTLITQNVDGLSARALGDAVHAHGAPTPEQEDPPLLEMHGRLFHVQCSNRRCAHIETNDRSPVCPALAGTEERVGAGEPDIDIPLEDLPRCSECGSLARPGVVWFGEVPHHLDEIFALAEKADLCLVVGTSSLVRVWNMTKTSLRVLIMERGRSIPQRLLLPK